MGKIKYIFGILSILLLMAVTAYGGYQLAFKGLIFPRVIVAGIDVTGINKEAALALLSSYFESDKNEVVLVYDDKEIANLDSLLVDRDFSWAVDQAISVGRNGNILTRLSEQFDGLIHGRKVDLPLKYDFDEIASIIEHTEETVSQEAVWPKLEIKETEVSLVAGKDGVELRSEELQRNIIAALTLPGKQIVYIPTDTVITTENPDNVLKAKQAYEKWKEKTPRITFRGYEKKFDNEELLNLFGLVNDPLNKEEYEDLLSEVAPKVETEPRDAVFIFENDRVNEFQPEIIGATIDIPAFKNKLAEYLYAGEDVNLEVPVILSYPKVRAGDINNLGIKELLGTGRSTYFHSIPGRVFNVNLASKRINGVLVAPGEEFSFNESVGEISKATGYQSAYIISGGRTILGDGGGVCQVSTTLFRAMLSAGLPVTERKAHAYRVGYYEQDSPPGIDATVFNPTADLKFLNDTGSHILVQTTVDTKALTLQIDLYGTSDGRVSTITKPRISSQSPPPETMYVDDPTLPLGTTKQIDWAAWGAKVSFDYKVEKNGEVVIEKTFYSNYQPWQAIYMKGTGDLAGRL